MSQPATIQSTAGAAPHKTITSLDDPLIAARAHQSRWLVRLMYVLSILVIGASLLALWVAYRYQTLVTLKQTAETRYAQLNAASPFNPQTAYPVGDPQTIPINAQKAADAGSVRASTFGNISPAAERFILKLLKDPHWRPSYIAELLQLAPDLRIALDQHLGNLALHKVSPDEYRWRLAIAINYALSDPTNADGARYRKVLQQASLLAGESGIADHIPTPEQMEARLKSLAAKAELPLRAPPPDRVLQSRLPTENDKLAAAAVDLFIVGTQFIDADEVPKKSPLRELLK